MFCLVERAKLKKMEKRIMAKLDDYIALQKAAMEQLGTAITGLSGDINTLSDLVTTLKAALAEGTMTEAQEKAMKEVTDQLELVANNATALDAKTPPNAPVPPPPVDTTPPADTPPADVPPADTPPADTPPTA